MSQTGAEMVGAARVARGLYWGRAWNLVGGCTKVSPACGHCWAEREAYRYRGKPFYAGLTDEAGHWTGEIREREELLDVPLHVRKPTVFAIWTDLFHRAVPGAFVDRALEVMAACPQHRFLVLTKRPERLEEAIYGVTSELPCRELGGGDYLPNLALGVTAENQEQLEGRLPALQMPCGLRFLSYEPALGPLDLEVPLLEGWLDWVIVGCESGPGRRPTRLEWVRDVVRQCAEVGVPCFVKQIEVPRMTRWDWRLFTWEACLAPWRQAILDYGGRVSHDPSEWPEDLRVRELPEAFFAEERA